MKRALGWVAQMAGGCRLLLTEGTAARVQVQP
jgi:hypothetical protein